MCNYITCAHVLGLTELTGGGQLKPLVGRKASGRKIPLVKPGTPFGCIVRWVVRSQRVKCLASAFSDVAPQAGAAVELHGAVTALITALDRVP